MYNFTQRLPSFLLTLLLVGLSALTSLAQSGPPQYAAGYDSKSDNITSPDKAADGDMDTAAKLTPTVVSVAPLLVSTEYMRLNFASLVPSQGKTSVVLQPSGRVDVGVLPRMVIKTYKKTGSTATEQESFSLDNLLKLNAGTTNKMVFDFRANKEFNQLEFQVTGSANVSSDFFLYEAYYTPLMASVTPLPVQLTTFQGKTTQAGVALNWTTASEQHNDHFVVERAAGTPDAFQALSIIKGAGTSDQGHQYQFVDCTPGGLRYYRLRQVDVDGKESFSPVVAVEASHSGSGLAAYPSLATETLTVEGTTGTQLSILDHTGKQVHLAVLAANASQQIDVRGLPGGVYFLRDAATGQSTRFVKAD